MRALMVISFQKVERKSLAPLDHWHDLGIVGSLALREEPLQHDYRSHSKLVFYIFYRLFYYTYLSPFT